MKKTLWLFAIIALMLGAFPALAEEKAKDEAKKEPAATEEAKKDDTASAATILSGNLPGDITYGKPEAKVRIVEYASLSCSHCRDFHKDVFSTLKTEYIDTGKVFFVYRHFPLNLPALRAAMLVSCVPEMERKQGLVHALFSAQADWAYVSNEKDLDEKLKKITVLAGIDDATYQTCTTDKKEETAILERQLKASKAVGIKSTPTIFVGGTLFTKTKDIAEMRKTIDALAGGTAAESKPTEAAKEAPGAGQ